MDRTRIIIHSDMNAFYASVEQAERPELRGLPVIVGGNEDTRHGIVLTASYEAKRRGVKTASALWEARKACPDAIIVPPRYGLYQRYSALARKIYYQYTDLVEPFGPDEAWLDISNSVQLAGGNARLVAQEISERIRSELGLSVSIGLSWNKIFAKFGSDYEKPDGFTVIDKNNYGQIVWSAPVQDLLYVGPATTRKLNAMGIYTIGELALAPQNQIKHRLGKMGLVVQNFARGLDSDVVSLLNAKKLDTDHEIKSVGNGLTSPMDIETKEVAQQLIWILGESVAQRLRAHKLQGTCVSVGWRDSETLYTQSAQLQLNHPTNITGEICHSAYNLLIQHWDPTMQTLRGLHVRVSNLSSISEYVQLDLFGVELERLKKRRLDNCIDDLRHRFGNHSVRRLSELEHEKLRDVDPEKNHVIHPVSFFA